MQRSPTYTEKSVGTGTLGSFGALDKELRKAPYRFDICNKLIQTSIWLKNEGAVNFYREHAAAHCPTTEEFWISWICDLKEKFSSVKNVFMEVEWEARVIQLYHASLVLCPTADLWVSYLKFLRQRSLVASTLGDRSYVINTSYIRQMCECAVRDLGLHGTEGPKIWSFYRHFEQFLLQEILEGLNASETQHSLEPSDRGYLSQAHIVDSDPLQLAKHQAETVRSLFYRQMQLPLSGLQDLWDEYRIFEAELLPELSVADDATENAAKLHETGLTEWERRKTMELQVMMSDDDKIETIQKLSSGWTNYIIFEKNLKSKDGKIRVCTLYWRACEDLGHLRADLWFEWFRWVLIELQDTGVASMILERAVRCHPTQIRLWSAYLGCERLRKPSNIDRICCVFRNGLGGIDVARYPENVVTLCKATADTIIHSFYLGPTAHKGEIKQDTPRGESEGSFPHLPSSTSCKASGFSGSFADVLESCSVLSLLGLISSPLQEKPASLNQQIVDVFLSSENILVDSLPSHNTPQREHVKPRGASTPQHDLVFNALKQLWKEWLTLCTTTITDLHLCEMVAARVLFCTTLQCVPTFVTLNSTSNIDWAALVSESAANAANCHGDAWALVAEAFTFSWGSAKQHPPLDTIWALGKSTVTTHTELFFHRWFQLSLIAEVPSVAQDISFLLLQAQQESPSKLSPASPYSVMTESSSTWPDLRESDSESSHPLLPDTDKSVMQVTLNQLRSRREKRRRRLSECDSEACLSDTSSDSSSVSTAFTRTPASFLLRKRLRTVTHTSPSRNTLSTLPCGPYNNTVSLSQPNESPPSSSCDALYGMPSDAVELIERATQCTWNGHECDGDPSLTPPVPPITSTISPLRRRRSLSVSPGSPLSHSSDASCIAPMASRAFLSTSQHQAEPPDHLSRQHATTLKRRDVLYTHHDSYLNDACCEPHSLQCKKKRRIDEEDGETEGEATHPHDLESIKEQPDVRQCPKTQPSPASRVGSHYKLLKSGLNDSSFNLPEQCDSLIQLMGCAREETTLYVSNLDRSVTYENIQAMFSNSPGVQEIRMVCNKKKAFKGVCYIDFLTPQLAEQAAATHQTTDWNGRRIKVQLSHPKTPIYEEKTLFFTTTLPIPPNVAQEQIDHEINAALVSETQLVSGNAIQPLAVRSRWDSSSNTFKGYGYIDFSSHEDAQTTLKALIGRSMSFMGFTGTFHIFPSIPMKPRRTLVAPEAKKNTRENLQNANDFLPQPCTLFVKNLSFSTTEETLRRHFEQLGNVQSVQLCRDEKNKSKGFGFVTLVSEKDAFSCRMLNDTFLDNRQICVSTSHRVPTTPHHMKRDEVIERTAGPRLRQRIRTKENPTTDRQDTSDACASPRKPLSNKDFKQFLI